MVRDVDFSGHSSPSAIVYHVLLRTYTFSLELPSAVLYVD